MKIRTKLDLLEKIEDLFVESYVDSKTFGELFTTFTNHIDKIRNELKGDTK